MTWTTPRTWTTGELVTAALLNTHIRDDLLELRSSTDWIDPVLLNGWTSGLPPRPGYRRLGSFVAIRGYVTGGTMSVPIFTLPPGFRPSAAPRIFTGWGESSLAHQQSERIDVNTNGDVNPVVGDNTAFSFFIVFSVL